MSSYNAVMIDIGIDRYSYDKYCDSVRFKMVDGGTVKELDSKYIRDDTSHGGVCLEYFELGAANPPDVFVMLKDLEPNMSSVDDLITALDWCIEQKAALVTLSAGTIEYHDAERLYAVVKRLSDAGICFFAGAGNCRTLSYPACIPGCIGVCVEYYYGSINSEFAIAKQPFDGIEIVLNPYNQDIESLWTNSKATAYLAGMISKNPGKLEQSKEMLSPENLYLYTRSAVTYKRSEDLVIVAIQNMSSNPMTRQFCLSLQRNFLDSQYYAISAFVDGEAAHTPYVHHYYSKYHHCNYTEFVDLMVNMCNPDLVLIDPEKYAGEINVILHQGNYEVSDKAQLSVDISNLKSSEAFKLIEDFFS